MFEGSKSDDFAAFIKLRERLDYLKIEMAEEEKRRHADITQQREEQIQQLRQKQEDLRHWRAAEKAQGTLSQAAEVEEARFDAERLAMLASDPHLTNLKAQLKALRLGTPFSIIYSRHFSMSLMVSFVLARAQHVQEKAARRLTSSTLANGRCAKVSQVKSLGKESSLALPVTAAQPALSLYDSDLPLSAHVDLLTLQGETLITETS